MARVYRIKNTGIESVWVGQSISQNEYYTIETSEHSKWAADVTVFADIASGVLVVNDGTDDISDPIAAWNWFGGEITFPVSDIDGMKLAVHASPKPSNTGNTIYALWIGAGDNMMTGEMSGGELCEFDLTPGKQEHSVDIQFHPKNGKVWLHEGYLKFSGGGSGDYFSASVVGEATPLQQSVALDLILDGDIVKYSPTGPGTGTHGFADPTAIVLAGRGYSNDGDWDFDGVDLTPNMLGTGGYRISTVEQIVHRFMHRIPVRGSSDNYCNMSSEESTIIPPHYFVRVTAHNTSNTTWYASVILETYRERTFNP